LYSEIEVYVFVALYAKFAKTLQKLSKNHEFGYVFASLSALAKFLKIKCNLAKNIYVAYKNNMDLTNAINQSKKALKALNEFIKIYENQWLREAKGMGYEKQIIRLGGLKERLRFTIDLLSKYKNNIK
jgi:hypothetical protein